MGAPAHPAMQSFNRGTTLGMQDLHGMHMQPEGRRDVLIGSENTKTLLFINARFHSFQFYSEPPISSCLLAESFEPPIATIRARRVEVGVL